MIIKLTEEQYKYLFEEIIYKIRKQIQSTKRGKFYYIQVSENVFDAINEWAKDELQKKGFDINYDLTFEGKVLEGIIDSFLL
jgi:hypothetical protein